MLATQKKAVATLERFRKDWKQHWMAYLMLIPAIVLLFIMKMGHILSLGYEKIILLYNPMTMETADVIATYVYRKGLQEFNYSFSTAVGMFNSVIGFILVITANKISAKVNEISLF